MSLRLQAVEKIYCAITKIGKLQNSFAETGPIGFRLSNAILHRLELLGT